MALVIVQDTWNTEDDLDLLEFTEDSRRLILDAESIKKIPLDYIKVAYCDTELVQSMLLPLYKPPSSYPDCFYELYRRHIRTVTINDLTSASLPLFCKPVLSNKSFDGTVVRTAEDLSALLMISGVNKDTAIFVSPVVPLINEFRLFLEVDGVHGVVESTEHVANYLVKPSEATTHGHGMQLFVEQVVASNSLGFCVVDIAQTISGQWLVVEVNPPFALSSYGYPIDRYCDYCTKAWRFVNSGLH